MINNIGGTQSANSAISTGNVALLDVYKVERIVASAIIGGTASEISGGTESVLPALSQYLQSL